MLPQQERPPQSERVIDDLETLRAMSHPLRMRMLEELREPRSVKELASALGTTPHRLYYHVKALERHGLIRVAGTRLVQGIVERRFQVTARTFSVSPDVAPEVLSESGTLGAVFDMTRRDIETLLRLRQGEGDAGPRGLVSQSSAVLSEERYAEFHRRLEALLDEFESEPSTEQGDRRYSLLVALYPTPREGTDACE